MSDLKLGNHLGFKGLISTENTNGEYNIKPTTDEEDKEAIKKLTQEVSNDTYTKSAEPTEKSDQIYTWDATKTVSKHKNKDGNEGLLIAEQKEDPFEIYTIKLDERLKSFADQLGNKMKQIKNIRSK